MRAPQIPDPHFHHLVRDVFPHRVKPCQAASFVRDHATPSDSHIVSHRVTSTLLKWGPRWGLDAVAGLSARMWSVMRTGNGRGLVSGVIRQIASHGFDSRRLHPRASSGGSLRRIRWAILALSTRLCYHRPWRITPGTTHPGGVSFSNSPSGVRSHARAGDSP